MTKLFVNESSDVLFLFYVKKAFLYSEKAYFQKFQKKLIAFCYDTLFILLVKYLKKFIQQLVNQRKKKNERESRKKIWPRKIEYGMFLKERGREIIKRYIKRGSGGLWV
jgi:hypothetical protein